MLSEAGPAGEDGAAGPRGERGEPGPAGECAPAEMRPYVVTFTAPVGKDGGAVEVVCEEPGDVLLSGGCSAEPAEGPGAPVVLASHPIEWAWVCEAGEAWEPYELTGYAMCAEVIQDE